MTTLSSESNLDDKDLELVTGGERTLAENIDRILFAVGCVLGGKELTVKGDQLTCHI